MSANGGGWPPTRFRRWIATRETSTGIARILTDAGEVFIKALGNREGPHALARDFIGTALAERLGLATFQNAIMEVRPEDEIPLGHDRLAQPGPAFVTRAMRGHSWDGTREELTMLDNPGAIPGLVILDTLLLNPDRHPPVDLARESNQDSIVPSEERAPKGCMGRKPRRDNVFLSEEGARKDRMRLIAMDFTDCLCSGGDLSRRIARIQCIQEHRIYGLFPHFRMYMAYQTVQEVLARLDRLDEPYLREMMRQIPDAWGVDDGTRDALCEFLRQRARFLPVHIAQVQRFCVVKQTKLPF